MKHLFMPFLFTVLAVLLMIGSKLQSGTVGDQPLPAMETFVIQPLDHETVNVWIPAERIGPEINRSCRLVENCTSACSLPAVVSHTKAPLCPDEIGRILAHSVSRFHSESMPLTIFNGWQWEYSFSLSQYDTATYNLPSRGGSWENAWEAILTHSTGSLEGRWIRASDVDSIDAVPAAEQISSIDVKTFSLLRVRDGYPKERQL